MEEVIKVEQLTKSYGNQLAVDGIGLPYLGLTRVKTENSYLKM